MRISSIRSNQHTSGFTLLELLIVISIMALLASLTMMGFSSAQINSSRNRTSAFHRAIMSGLEAYHSDNGEYPEPRGSSQRVSFGTKDYDIGGALMLYQALSGDGNNEIKSDNTNTRSSNGIIDNDQEIAEIKLKEMPKEMSKQTPNGWMIMDGFGHPFQYTYPKRAAGEPQGTPSSNTINTTYDLWSYADDDKHTNETGISAKQDVKIAGKWIKNW